MSDKILAGREVIFEYQKMGNLLRVAAMDTKTMTEIIISCPPSASEDQMQMMALRRLEFVLKKKGLI